MKQLTQSRGPVVGGIGVLWGWRGFLMASGGAWSRGSGSAASNPQNKHTQYAALPDRQRGHTLQPEPPLTPTNNILIRAEIKKGERKNQMLLEVTGSCALFKNIEQSRIGFKTQEFQNWGIFPVEINYNFISGASSVRVSCMLNLNMKTSSYSFGLYSCMITETFHI